MIYYWWCFVCFFQHNSKFVELVISNVCILIYEIILFLLLIILGRRFEVYKLENVHTQWITCEYCVSISRCRLQISFLIFFSIWKIHKNHESAKICEKWVNLKMYPNWMKFCFRILSQYRFQTKVKVVRKITHFSMRRRRVIELLLFSMRSRKMKSCNLELHFEWIRSRGNQGKLYRM